MSRKYDISKKSDMRRLERDLKATIQKAAEDQYKKALSHFECPNCGQTFNAHAGHVTCPYCHTEYNFQITNR